MARRQEGPQGETTELAPKADNLWLEVLLMWWVEALR